MKHNVGTIDRVLRIALGLALIGASWLGHIGMWGWIGLLPLATGVFRFCPAYWPFGLSTCPRRAAGPRTSRSRGTHDQPFEQLRRPHRRRDRGPGYLAIGCAGRP